LTDIRKPGAHNSLQRAQIGSRCSELCYDGRMTNKKHGPLAVGGRPTVMTEEVVRKLEEAFTMACTMDEACGRGASLAFPLSIGRGTRGQVCLSVACLRHPVHTPYYRAPVLVDIDGRFQVRA
jgi:hypothetical protein